MLQVTQQHISAIDECAEYLSAARHILESEQLTLPGIEQVQAQLANTHALVTQLREKARLWAKVGRAKASVVG